MQQHIFSILHCPFTVPIEVQNSMHFIIPCRHGPESKHWVNFSPDPKQTKKYTFRTIHNGRSPRKTDIINSYKAWAPDFDDTEHRRYPT